MAALIVAAMAARASDAVPVQTEPDTASISAAKQQLDEMKSAGVAAGAGVDTKLSPQLPVTQLNPTNDYVAPSPKQRSDAVRRRRSENWLVDAVMRPEPKDRVSRDNRNRSGVGSEPKAFGNASATMDNDEQGTMLDHDDIDPEDPFDVERAAVNQDPVSTTARSSATTSAIDKPDRSAEFDPLAKYLTDWLSPQDLSLLKNSPDAAPTSSSPPGVATPNPTADAGRQSTVPGLDAFTESGGVNKGNPEDNPFLQFLKPSEPAVAMPPAPVDVPPPTLLPEPLPPAPDASAKSTIPDFAKPAFDDKYYKPLKRF